VRVPFTYEYPRPAVTVDTVLATVGERGDLRVLLIQRGNDPFAGRWALPGGFVDQHEDLLVAARREMLEETCLQLGSMVQLGAYGTPHRDPRGHTVGVAFLAICGPDELEPQAGDDAADCRWFSARRPPKLAFDHSEILRDARTTFARLAASKQEFTRTFAGRRRPTWIEKVRRAARGTA
jgi:8-oxo-dGTP diphosphatase